MIWFYKFYVNNFVFLRNLYTIRNEDNSINTQVLSFALVVFNIFSIVVIFLSFFSVNLNFSLELKVPKSVFGGLFGVVFGSIYYSIAYYANKNISYRIKYQIFKNALNRMPPKWVSLTYLVLTFVLLTYVVFGILNK